MDMDMEMDMDMDMDMGRTGPLGGRCFGARARELRAYLPSSDELPTWKQRHAALKSY